MCSLESVLRRTRRVRLVVFARFVRYCTRVKEPKKRRESSMSSYRGIKTSSRSSILKEDNITEETTSPKQIVGIVLSFLGDMYTRCDRDLCKGNDETESLE